MHIFSKSAYITLQPQQQQIPSIKLLTSNKHIITTRCQTKRKTKMSSNCIIQNCPQNCCNIDGFCPISYGTSNQMNCYYYYSWYIWSFWWIYFVIVIASLLCLSILIACVVACCRRNRRYQQDTIVISQPAIPAYHGQYGPNANYDINMATMGMATGGNVMMGEPVYLASQNTPLQYQQDNIYAR